MIKATKSIPERAVITGRRMKEINEFLRGGAQFGEYKMLDNEEIKSVYHSFKHALIAMKLIDRLDISMRRGKLYFIRRDI